MAEGTGRFDPDNEQLRKSLAWHAEITKDLQGRVLKARRYVTAQIGDPELLNVHVTMELIERREGQAGR